MYLHISPDGCSKQTAKRGSQQHCEVLPLCRIPKYDIVKYKYFCAHVIKNLHTQNVPLC